MDKSAHSQPPLMTTPAVVESIRNWDQEQHPVGARRGWYHNENSDFLTDSAGRLGIWILIASEIVIFAGLLGSFILFRMAHPEWAQEAGHLNLIAGTLNTLVLLTSNFFMMKASVCAEHHQDDAAKRFMLYTMLLGAAFLGVKGFEYAREFGQGEFPSTGNFWSFYFLMTGIHALHILGGLVAIGLLWVQAVKGTLGPFRHRVALTGIYWSFVEVVWVFLFPLLYLLS